MPWYTTSDARRDADKQRHLRECDVHAGCWRCGIGRFHLMAGSDYLWQCDKCGHVGHLKVIPQSRDSKKECSSLCAEGEKCSVTADGQCDAELKPNAPSSADAKRSAGMMS